MGLPIGILRVLDHSMEPILHENDYVLVNYWHCGKFRVGDIVVLKEPNSEVRIIKQIDRIRKGMLYVVGANKMHSKDSRNFGEIDKSRVVGKMLIKV